MSVISSALSLNDGDCCRDNSQHHDVERDKDSKNPAA